MRTHFHRRGFLKSSLLGTAGLVILKDARSARAYQANDKLSLAIIGACGQGGSNTNAVAGENLVALCDVDQRRADETHKKYPHTKRYTDFRKMLDELHGQIDAVVVSTPDHTHAVAAVAAMKLGKHVYCEKPLTYSVYEARQVAEAARKAGVATQLGNQGQASEEARLVCEFIADGAIGGVHEVQVWSPARFWAWPAGDGRPPETPPVPDGLDWDLWLGPAPMRPYHPAYHPWTWRNWWDFGTGLLGDLGCHKLSTVFKALKLGHPTSVEASSTKLNPETYPLGVMARFEFPARDEMPPVTISWYDGGLKPPFPKDLEANRGMGDVIYLGDKGTLMNHRIIPETKMQAYGKPPRRLERSVGHYKEFVDACRGGAPAGANFVDHAGLLTEVCMLGNVALRAGKKLAWDGPNLRVTNDEAANGLLHREYRQGWTL